VLVTNRFSVWVLPLTVSFGDFAACFRLSTPQLFPIHPVGIDNGVHCHEEHGHDDEADSVGLNEQPEHGNGARELEQFRAVGSNCNAARA
jgi:hypothetical protein